LPGDEEKNLGKVVRERWPEHLAELDLAINRFAEGEPIRINVGHGRLEVSRASHSTYQE